MKKEHIIALIFLLTIAISTLFSPYKDIAIFGNYDRNEGLIMWGVYIALFIISSRYLIINKKMINIIFIVASIMGIYGVFQFYGFDPIQKWALGTIKVSNSFGTIGNRNFYSTYICLFLFISMSIFIFKGEKRYLIYSIFLFSGLLCSLTRGGWLAFILFSIIGFMFIVKNKRALKRVSLVFIIFSVVFFVINLTSNNKITGRTDKSLIISESGNFNGSAGARINILKLSWKAFCDKPFLGTGPDTLKQRLSEDYPMEMLDYLLKYKQTIDKAHNEFLELAVSCGIFTLLSYLLLIILILIPIIKNFKDDRCKTLFLVIIGYLIQSFFNISVIIVAPLFWIFMGYCVKVNGYKEIDNKLMKSIDIKEVEVIE